MLFRLLFREPMMLYSVYEPPNAPADRLERAAGILFIKDSFSLLAALLPPVWLLAHSLWIEFAVYLLAAILLVTGMELAGVGAIWQILVVLALHLWFGFEAAGIRRWKLERGGWQPLGTVIGSSMLDCERRFFDAWLPQQRTDSAVGS